MTERTIEDIEHELYLVNSSLKETAKRLLDVARESDEKRFAWAEEKNEMMHKIVRLERENANLHAMIDQNMRVPDGRRSHR